MTSGNWLTCETHQGLMDIYVSASKNKDKNPIVIVLQEAFGVNHHIRTICDRLAREGFLAAAPDLFHRDGRRLDIPYTDRHAILPLLGRMKNQAIIDDVRNTINFLDDLPNANTQDVSTVGFCVGGFASVLCASKLNIKKMVSFYGGGMIHQRDGIGLRPILPDIGLIKSKCLFFFGGIDASISQDDILEISKKLTDSKISYEITTFENSDHGFFCDERKTFDPSSAEVAWDKTIKFLRNS